ncbi:MAG: purine-nucleoside phosphorylase, partial [Synergistales bacterium]|nr:purine-nucleoside phosphorylase [Synergistales bacterium]
MEVKLRVEEALEYVKKNVAAVPEAAVVLGSGLGKVAEEMHDAVVIPYEEIPHWPRSTAPGHAGRLVIGLLGGKLVALMQGRAHYYEGHSMEEVTFPVRAFGRWGIPVYIATNASGGIHYGLRP